MNNDYEKFSLTLFDIGLNQKLLNVFYHNSLTLLDIVKSNQMFNEFFIDLSIDKNKKKKVIQQIFNKKFNNLFIYFVWTVIDLNQTKSILNILNKFISIYFEYTKTKLVKIYSAFPLNSKQLSNIKNILNKKTNMNIKYTFTIDKNLIGGVKIVSDSFTIDNTIKTKINNIKYGG